MVQTHTFQDCKSYNLYKLYLCLKPTHQYNFLRAILQNSENSDVERVKPVLEVLEDDSVEEEEDEDDEVIEDDNEEEVNDED